MGDDITKPDASVVQGALFEDTDESDIGEDNVTITNEYLFVPNDSGISQGDTVTFRGKSLKVMRVVQQPLFGSTYLYVSRV